MQKIAEMLSDVCRHFSGVSASDLDGISGPLYFLFPTYPSPVVLDLHTYSVLSACFLCLVKTLYWEDGRWDLKYDMTNREGAAHSVLLIIGPQFLIWLT